MGSYRDNLIAAMVVFLVINTLAIAARLYVRIRLLTRAIGMDDLMLCLVFVCFSVALPLFARHPGTMSSDGASFTGSTLLTWNLKSGYVIHCGLESASMYWGYAAPTGEKHRRYDSAKATDVSPTESSLIFILVTNYLRLVIVCESTHHLYMCWPS